MAYIRGHFYIYENGESVYFGHGRHLEVDTGRDGRIDDNSLCSYGKQTAEPTGVHLPYYIVEEFVTMYWSRMTDEERANAIKRVSEKYGGGNFGADGVASAMNMPTVMDVVQEHFPEKFSALEEK